jgi:cytochrome c oxidase subunit II
MSFLLAQSAQLPPVAPTGGTVWMPPEASGHAPFVDNVFYFIYWVSVFFFVLIVALLLYFVWRYRRRSEGAPAGSQASHNTTLEIIWSVIPLALVIVMFYLGFRGFMDMSNPPADAMDVYVTGQKWLWTFKYPNGHDDTELHVPVDRSVRLILASNDVIHSFFIPAFRVKRDVVPGRYNKIWFKATKTGEYLALCSEFCGTQHSDMLARVVVHEPGAYETWLAAASDPFATHTMSEVGAMLVTRRCGGCHSVDGRAGIGPTFRGIWDHEVRLRGQPPLVVDENYIRESIMLPQAKVVEGFEPVMPTFKGQLKDQEITAIIEYIKGLSK